MYNLSPAFIVEFYPIRLAVDCLIVDALPRLPPGGRDGE